MNRSDECRTIDLRCRAVDMAASIFKAAWWPIHVAVAWVLTRNRIFVERSNRAGRSPRSVAVALAMDKVRAKPTGRYFKRATKAWSALREEIAASNVRASGTPFQRVADLEGGAVNTSGMAREIPAVEIASLRLQDDDNDKDCLVPEDWRVAHGSSRKNLRGYRNVYVFRDDVLRAFDADVSKVLGVGRGNEKIEGPPGLPRGIEAKGTHLRVRPETSGRIAEFSDHEAD